MSRQTKNSTVPNRRRGALVKNAPLVSVVIPAYDCAAFIADTLDSALAQTFKDYEIILVNDGSPDTPELEAILERYFDKIIYIKQTNGGAAAARNAAINAGSGEFLAFLDGDDIWLPDYLAEQLKAINEKNCDLIYADARLFGSGGDAAETFMVKSPSAGAVTPLNLIGGKCSVITSGTVARRAAIIDAGMFDKNLPRLVSEDFDLWFRLAKRGARLDFHKKILLKYRVRQTGLSGSNVKRVERTIAVLDWLESHYELTAEEREKLENQTNLAAAELNVERGKHNLILENFAEARSDFRRANEYYRKFKYTALCSLLLVSPGFVLKLFKKKRPAEVALVASGDSPE